ncbi:hypothetical protein GOP47_0009321 [Adiantum capillus-veneris]|uniref:Uncharacterized protein n=1 Tax=Adiantum capillus-veneris TaxID=13818 RepID=A0A9D4UWS9_ADICA|nr:hypothetical protein GOP47_0009321 [Adiantum capillus-veneris]
MAMAELRTAADLLSKEAVLLQYVEVEHAAAADYEDGEEIQISTPSSLDEKAKEQLVTSRIVKLVFVHPLAVWGQGERRLREAVAACNLADDDAVEAAGLVDSFIKLVEGFRRDADDSLVSLVFQRVIFRNSEDKDDDESEEDADDDEIPRHEEDEDDDEIFRHEEDERSGEEDEKSRPWRQHFVEMYVNLYVAMAVQRGITPVMAETIMARILPALDACHSLAMAQALDLLLSSPVLEELWLIDYHWSYSGFVSCTSSINFFQRALSMSSRRCTGLRTLRMVQAQVSIDDLRSGVGRFPEPFLRDLCAALSESHLRTLHLDSEFFLGKEEEEILSRVIESPGCNLEILHIRFASDVDVELERLSTALMHPNCKIWCLGLSDLSRRQSQVFGDHALRNEKNRLRMLRLFNSRFIPWEAMGSPTCCKQLEALVIAGDRYFGFTVDADGLPGLLRAASSKVRYLKIEPIGLSMESVEALQHSKVTHLNAKYVNASSLANFLGSAHCQLESFECEQELKGSDAELLITALQKNYQSRLRSLRLTTGRFNDRALNVAQRCEHIVQRNALFLASTQPPFVAATSAKLFICGHSGVGKTTMARNFNRRFTLPAAFQRHSTTQGIAMQGVLDYNGKQAVICDIAGQEEFHAFHHYFVKGSETNLFLVVCKVLPDAGDNSNMEQDVRTCVEHINDLAGQYTNLLDIHKDGGGNMCFEVVALQVASLKQIKHAVGVALEDVLANHPLVPSLCKKVRDSIRLDKSNNGLWRFHERNPQKKRVVTIEELTETVLLGNDDNKAARISAVKFTMACMHDMGESLYFGVDYKNDSILVNSATLDMQWFVQELVGIFIQVCRDDDWSWNKRKHKQQQIQRQQDDYKVSMIRIVPMIEKMCSPNQVSYVLTALHKMGVLLPFDDNWNGAWSRTHPKQVIVPALLQNEFSGTDWGSDGYIYWGRRMTCKDQVCTLLPSGVFNVIQVSLKQLCKNPSFKLGKGWVCFEENSVCVVVRVGGDTNHWVDRQWVDIMVMTLEESKKCLLAEEMVNKIKNYVAEECQSSLKLVEYVLNPTYIKSRVQENIIQDVATTAVPLEVIYKEALEKGLGYSHTWDMHIRNEVSELLMPGELQGHVRNWERSISSNYNEAVVSIYSTAKVESWEDFFQGHNNLASTTINPELMKILMYMIHQLQSIDHQLVGIAAGINDLKAIARHTQEAMDLYGQKVLAHCSKMLDKLNVSCPRYPYFTNMNNKIAKHYLVVATQVKLYYCCESSKGIHQMDGRDGLVLELAHGWFTKYSHIIIPALTGIYFTMKITGKALGAGDLFDFTLDFFKDKITDTLNSVLTPKLACNAKQPNEFEINEIFAMVEKKREGERIEHFMLRTFGLKLKKQAWLCERCFSQC